MKFSHLIGLLLITLSSCSKEPQNIFDPNKNIVLCVGDSLTEGYGLKSFEAYPALLQKKLDEVQPGYQVINAGNSGDTTADGLRKIPELLETYKPETIHLVILALGANDSLKKRPIDQTRKNFVEILNIFKNHNIPVLLVGYEVKRFGFSVQSRLKNVYAEQAEAFQVPLVENMLEGVALKPDLNLSDGLHPNTQGTQIVFENIWEEAKDFF